MIDPKLIRKEPERILENLRRRRMPVDISALTVLDEKRRSIQKHGDDLRSVQKRKSDDMARAMREKQPVDGMRAQLKETSAEISRNEEEQRQADAAFENEVLVYPNILLPDVPDGATGEDNPVVSEWGTKPRMDFKPQPHWDIGEKLGILDFDRAAKIARARFTCLMGLGARLERVILSFMMDTHASRGYTEVWPPFMVSGASLRGTGQLPKFREDLFKCEGEDLWLVPTAEVPVTNLHAGEILPETSLPIRYVAYTPCFRAEAGAAGKDTRGMIRQHQFDKVELVKFCRPDQSADELEKLRADAEEILRRLGLHYRVVTLCTGDVGFAAARTYDIEVWMPGQNAYREISSCSTFTDFQARRAMIRYRSKNGAAELVHTLNGSGLAVGRTLVAILEQYQQADGSVLVPDALRPYMGGIEKISRG